MAYSDHPRERRGHLSECRSRQDSVVRVERRQLRSPKDEEIGDDDEADSDPKRAQRPQVDSEM